MIAFSKEVVFYKIEGALPPDQPSYIQRSADNELFQNLREGHLCYVLSSRQVGKSSLMVRTAERLRQAGVAVAIVDLTRVGKNVTPRQWYFGLLTCIGEDLGIEDELEEYWGEPRDISPLQRWTKAIREVVLKSCRSQLVIFFDEIDVVQSLEFDTDEFFGGLRELYQRRAQDADLNRLTFCLLGVATPTDLVKNVHMAPFNIGRRIELNDFSEAEAALLVEGLKRDETTARRLIQRILHWTGGHPYLTHSLCEAIAGNQTVNGGNDVDTMCKEKFLSAQGRENDHNLRFVHQRILEGGDAVGLLSLYLRILDRQSVRADDKDPLIERIQLSGITRVVRKLLKVRNRIYERVFDRDWVLNNMPDDERRRHRAALIAGIRRASLYWGLIVAIGIASFTYFAWQKAQRISNLERQRADEWMLVAKANELEAKDREREAELADLKAKEMALSRDLAQLRAEAGRLGTEKAIWQMIKDDPNPRTFQAYLEIYPQGLYLRQARRKLRQQPPPNVELNGVIRGRIVDVNTKQPILGASIHARNQATGAEREMVSNEQGEFLVPILPPGTYAVWINSEGYDRQMLVVPVGAERITRIAPRYGELRKSRP